MTEIRQKEWVISGFPDIKYEVCEITPDGKYHLVDGCSYRDFDIAKVVIQALRNKADIEFTQYVHSTRTFYKLRKRTVTLEDIEEKDLV